MNVIIYLEGDRLYTRNAIEGDINDFRNLSLLMESQGQHIIHISPLANDAFATFAAQVATQALKVYLEVQADTKINTENKSGAELVRDFIVGLKAQGVEFHDGGTIEVGDNRKLLDASAD